jgi:multidrug resistance efflux pump
MDRPLPVVPRPKSQLWHEIRIRFAPFAVLLGVVAVVVVMWRQNVAVPTLLGEVETIKSNISSPKAGKLAQLNVTRMQRVTAGDVIGQVITTDPKILQSSLAVVQAEIQLLRVNLQPVLGQQRFGLSYDRIRLDWMDQRVQMATAEVRLQLAETEWRRIDELFKEKIVSEQALDRARSTRDSLQTEVHERQALVAEQAKKLQELGLGENGSAYPRETNPEDVLRASIKVQEEKLRLTEAELSPIKLIVPMDGMVDVILHRSGEAIAAGEPIVTLAALSSDRILGYLREPLVLEPKVGMKVEVRARSLNGCVREAKIIQVGCQMEPISSTLLPLNNNRFHELGLPLLVSLPDAQKLLPGEIVDLRLLPATSEPAAHLTEARKARSTSSQ